MKTQIIFALAFGSMLASCDSDRVEHVDPFPDCIKVCTASQGCDENFHFEGSECSPACTAFVRTVEQYGCSEALQDAWDCALQYSDICLFAEDDDYNDLCWWPLVACGEIFCANNPGACEDD